MHLAALLLTLPLLLRAEPPAPPEDGAIGDEASGEEAAAPEIEGPLLEDAPDLATPPAAAPPEPSRGSALLIAGAAAGGVGLIANVGRIVILNSTCRNALIQSGEEAQLSCGVNRAGSFILFTGLAPLSNIASAVLLGVGGSKRGINDAYRAAHRGGQDRSGGGALAAGIAMLTTGVIGYLGVRVYAFTDLNGAITCQADGECFLRRWSIYLAGIETMQATAAAGAGLLGYGAGLRKGRASYPRVSLQPILAPTYAGIGLGGAF